MNVGVRAGRVSAAVIGVVCGLELVAAIVIGGAGITALFSIEAAFVTLLLGGVILSTLHARRGRRIDVSVEEVRLIRSSNPR